MNLLRASFLAPAFALSAAISAASWTPSATFATTWDSNVTNADRAADVIGALQLAASADAFAPAVSLGHDDSLVFGAALDAEDWPRFDGLNRIAAGPRLAWRHKFGLGALAPVFSVELSANGLAAQDPDRRGFDGAVRAVWRQRFDEATQFSFSFESARTDARDGVYDRTSSEAAAELTREISEGWRLGVTVRWRDGEVLSYATPPRPEISALARDQDENDTFHQPFIVYSLSARTWSGALALTRALGETSALTFGYEERTSRSGPLRYVNHLVSTSVTRQF